MTLALSVGNGSRAGVGSNGSSVKMSEVHYGAMANERLLEMLAPRPPIDHRARHRSALTRVLTIDQEPKTGIVKKRHRRSRAEYVFLPMARVGRDGNEGKHLNAMS